MRRILSGKPAPCGTLPAASSVLQKIYFTMSRALKVGCGGATSSDDKYYHAISNTANYNKIFRRFRRRE